MSDFILSVARQRLFDSIKLVILIYLITALWCEVLFKVAPSTALLSIFSSLNKFKLIKTADVSFSWLTRSKFPWPYRDRGPQWCVGTHVLISHRNQGLAGGVYLKEIAGMQLLDLA